MNLGRIVSTLVFSLTLVASVAHADTIMSFTGSLTDGGTISGTVTFNPAGGTFIATNFTVKDGGHSYLFNTPFGHGGSGNVPFADLIATSAGLSGPVFFLDVPSSTPLAANYSGGNVCSVTTACAATSGFGLTFSSVVNVQSGSLVSTTPEPSSLLLMGTGVLSICGAIRRKVFRT